MQFNSPDFVTAINSGLASGDTASLAKAQNVHWEQGVSPERRAFFESVPGRSPVNSWDNFLKHHIDYVNKFVKTSSDTPDTFLERLKTNIIDEMDEALVILRLERLERPLQEYRCEYSDFLKAFQESDNIFLQSFCDLWNDLRDFRPAFSTLMSEVSEEINSDDWPDMLRDCLGLAHYSPQAEPIPVALCKYSLADVKRNASSAAFVTMPTVLDSEPWEYYFPAPKALQFGRALALYPCQSDDSLKIELLNSKVKYGPQHIWKVGQVVRPVPGYDIAQLRMRHLEALRIASNDEGFGA